MNRMILIRSANSVLLDFSKKVKFVVILYFTFCIFACE